MRSRTRCCPSAHLADQRLPAAEFCLNFSSRTGSPSSVNATRVLWGQHVGAPAGGAQIFRTFGAPRKHARRFECYARLLLRIFPVTADQCRRLRLERAATWIVTPYRYAESLLRGIAAWRMAGGS